MKANNIIKGLTKIAGRPGLVIQKHSPTILLVVGIVGVVGGAVLACKGTLRAKEVLEQHREKKATIDECAQGVKDGVIPADAYPEERHQKDLVVVYSQTAWEFVKLYGPAILATAAGITCLIGGHRILTKRNVALVAAYKAVEEGFTAYRKRVVDEYGPEKDTMFKNGLHAEKVVEMGVDEKGNPKAVEKEKMVVTDPNTPSIYARYFDHNSKEWQSNAEFNRFFLRTQQNYFNDLLRVRGHVFLNEVYDALGIERCSEGQIVGWIKGSGDHDGDGYIDFGMHDVDIHGYGDDYHNDTISDERRDFINGYMTVVLLDFNVDGVIYDKL
jgi:hypothetical protein